MTVEVPVFPEQAAMHLRRYHVSCLHRLRQLPLFVLVFVLRIATVGAQYNVTVGASNAVLEYQPPDAWEKVTDQMLGDGTARITRKKGAWVALAFTGTGVYFQTTRAQRRGISAIDLDGESFKVDSSLTRTDGEDLGILWGILSLKDEKHVIKVTQSAVEGTELAVNAFVYITSKAPPPIPTLRSDTTGSPGPLNPDNPYFPRNLALVFIGTGLALLLSMISIYMVKRCRKSAAIDKTLIRLAMSPTSPTWRSNSFAFGETPSLRTDASSILKTPSSTAFLIRHSRQDSAQSIDQVLTPVRQIPHEQLVRNTKISASTPQRPKFVLPTTGIDLTSTRGPSSRVTMASLESISPIIPATSASSVLEHDGIISLTPGMISDYDHESMSQQRHSPESSV